MALSLKLGNQASCLSMLIVIDSYRVRTDLSLEHVLNILLVIRDDRVWPFAIGARAAQLSVDGFGGQRGCPYLPHRIHIEP